MARYGSKIYQFDEDKVCLQIKKFAKRYRYLYLTDEEVKKM